MTRAALATKVGSSDYNHYGAVGATTLNWTRTSGGTNGTLAQWRTDSGGDANSSLTQNTTFDLTAPGTAPAHLLADIHLASGTGPLAGSGYPLALGVSIDADGYLRSATTPDAGPFEYGATDLPDDPEFVVDVDVEPDVISIYIEDYESNTEMYSDDTETGQIIFSGSTNTPTVSVETTDSTLYIEPYSTDDVVDDVDIEPTPLELYINDYQSNTEMYVDDDTNNHVVFSSSFNTPEIYVENQQISININTYFTEDTVIDVDVEPSQSDLTITDYIHYAAIDIQHTVISSNINIDIPFVNSIDIISNINIDPDPIEYLISTYIQSAAGQIDIDLEPSTLELYYQVVTPSVFANSNTLYANPTGQLVILDQPSVGTISSIVYLEEDPNVVGYDISTGVTILAGTGTITYPGYGSLLITVTSPNTTTTSLPGGNIPGMPVEPNASSKEYYDYEYIPNQNIDSNNLTVDDYFTTQENIQNKDIDIVPILSMATNVENDVTKLNHNISETFIENTIKQTNRLENRNKIRVVTANYQKFTSTINGVASRFQIRRR
jgi:hypothetical protein